MIFLIGIGWILSTLGVLFGDTTQTTNSFISIMMFMTRYFSTSEFRRIRWITDINPIGYISSDEYSDTMQHRTFWEC